MIMFVPFILAMVQYRMVLSQEEVYFTTRGPSKGGCVALSFLKIRTLASNFQENIQKGHLESFNSLGTSQKK